MRERFGKDLSTEELLVAEFVESSGSIMNRGRVFRSSSCVEDGAQRLPVDTFNLAQLRDLRFSAVPTRHPSRLSATSGRIACYIPIVTFPVQPWRVMPSSSYNQ